MSKQTVNYWLKTSQHDYRTMLGLFRIKRYSDCLFYGHIILEKNLKALVVKNTGKQAPYIHDLVRLQELAKIQLEKDDLKFLKEINNFNIRVRYPDYKLRFYKICTKEFTKKRFKKIVSLYRKLCQKLK
ncbi:HEPN domain-containing protein [Patescibacteria group bacterium]|nr:HEPN domain-containing protein [Patescibacteria group bacterium]